MIFNIVDNLDVFVTQAPANHLAAINKYFTVSLIDCGRRYFGHTNQSPVVNFFDFNKGRINLHLLPDLIKFCDKSGFPYQIVDSRPEWPHQSLTADQIGPDFLAGIALESYQLRCIRAACDADFGIIDAVTGSGKCIVGESKVVVNRVECEIESLFLGVEPEQIVDVSKRNLYVFGPNGQLKINALYKTGRRMILKLTTENGAELRGVYEHRIYTKRGWVQLKDLKNDDEIQIHPELCIGNRNKAIYHKKNVEENRQETWADESSPICQFVVCIVREQIREVSENIHSRSRAFQKTALSEMYIISSYERKCCGESAQASEELGSLCCHFENRESDEKQRDSGESLANLQSEVWCQSSSQCTMGRQVYSENERIANEKDERYFAEFSDGNKEIQKNNGCEISRRNSNDKSRQIADVAQESPDSGCYRRVICASSQNSNQVCEYEIWSSGLPEPIRIEIHKTMRRLESSSNDYKRSDYQPKKFVVLVRLFSEDKNQTDDSRDKIEVFIHSEENECLVEEESGNEVRENTKYGIPFADLLKISRNGFCDGENWSKVRSIENDGVEYCYDFQLADPSHAYWTNGILSHNTEMMAAICKMNPGCNTVILSEQRVVIEQISERLQLRDVKDVGLFYSGKSPDGQSIVIASVQSSTKINKTNVEKPIQSSYKTVDAYVKALTKYESMMTGFKNRNIRAEELRDIIKQADMLLVDECDLAVSSMYRSILRIFFKGRKRYGFTGSVFDKDKKLQSMKMRSYLGPIIARASREEVLAAGRINDVRYTMIVFTGAPEEVHDSSMLNIAIDEKLTANIKYHKLLNGLCDFHVDEKTLILVESKKLGAALEEYIPNSVFICGDTSSKARNAAVEKFRTGEIKILIGGKILKRGFDLKGGFDNIILSTGGKLSSDFRQRLGRGYRRSARGYTRIYDFMFRVNKYLYSHSRERLKTIVKLGIKTVVIYPNGFKIDGADLVKRNFNVGKNWRQTS